MKAINYIFTLTVTMFLAACTNAEEDFSIDNSTMTLESMQSMYGMEFTVLEQAEKNNVPSATVEQIQGILEALRDHSGISQNCKVVEAQNKSGNTQEILKHVQMTAEYQARTRNGGFLEKFALCVSLNFKIDAREVYYMGADYTYSTDLFNWRANGLSLAPIKNTGYYGFDSTSYLYFRINDKDDQIARVPVSFNGKYNFSTSDGAYSFTLAKLIN